MAATFAARLRRMLDAGHPECGWHPAGDMFWIANPQGLASRVIPLYFDHASFASLTRALNAHSFHKMSPSTWGHPCFLRDNESKEALIVRKPAPPRLRGKALKEHQQRLEASKEQHSPQGTDATSLALQVEREKMEVAAAAKEVARLEKELAEAQADARLDENFLELFEQKAVAQVASRMASLAELSQKLDGEVKPEDFGLQAEDLAMLTEDDLALLGEGLERSVDDGATAWDGLQDMAQDIPAPEGGGEHTHKDEVCPDHDDIVAIMEQCKLRPEEWKPYECPIACLKDAEMMLAKHCNVSRGKCEELSMRCAVQALAAQLGCSAPSSAPAAAAALPPPPGADEAA